MIELVWKPSLRSAPIRLGRCAAGRRSKWFSCVRARLVRRSAFRRSRAMFRQMILLAFLAVLAREAIGAELPDTSKMNILFINIEDCYAGVWGCYGNPICKTPNIDR